jgi:hypothetical protein
MVLIRVARRPNASADLKAICTGIGASLRAQLSNVLSEPIPEKMTDLLKQLDQPKEDNGPANTR